MERAYAVLDSEGNVREVTQDNQRAYSVARSISPYVSVETAPEAGAALSGFGAVAPEQMPGVALRSSGLHRVDANAVMKMSVEQAHGRLVKFFPKIRTRLDGTVERVRPYETARGMADALLGQNYKTAKETPERPSDVQGLSLLPFDMAGQRGMAQLLRDHQGQAPALPLRGLGLCVGSSAACRASCLVYSGHNMMDRYNTAAKAARTTALLQEPEAFCRMLTEAVNRHLHSSQRRGVDPFVRLNVFSDVPWELVFPEVFGMFSKLWFYDYTKVPGRQTPGNYDITFSWSGVNEDFVRSELQRGRRIAVVFMTPGITFWRKLSLAEKMKNPGAGLPKEFLGQRVVDGDMSDVRPRDPAPSVVGLRWKLPLMASAEGKRMGVSSFVVPVVKYGDVLVASQAARHEPIVEAQA